MKIQKQNSNEERRILIAMIVDETVLGRISSKWQNRMFKSKWANLIANWCIKYHNTYEEAPLHQIESLYETWSEKTKDESTIKLVSKFLDSLSDEYEALKEESNSDYIIDMAGKYFNKVQMQNLIEQAQDNIDSSEIDIAHEKLSSYNKIEMGVGEGIDILHDTEAIKEAFKDKGEPLIIYPGDLGKFFGNVLERDAFISFMGSEGKGKSFWLMDIVFRAITQRRKVAFFEVGDMSQNQIMRRLMIRTARHPLFACTINYPKRIIKDKEGVRVKSKYKSFKNNLSWRIAYKACKLLMKRKVKSKSSYCKLSCHPNSSLSVKGIVGILQDWAKEDWEPDVVVIDYADILDMSNFNLEGRDRINETWKQLRALSQKYHCLLVTATQADAASYSKDTLGMSNFSEDKRKFAHVTAMIGINQTEKEKDIGVMRLNHLKVRDDFFNTNRCVCVAGCLKIANPAIKSCF